MSASQVYTPENGTLGTEQKTLSIADRIASLCLEGDESMQLGDADQIKQALAWEARYDITDKAD